MIGVNIKIICINQLGIKLVHYISEFKKCPTRKARAPKKATDIRTRLLMSKSLFIY